MNESSHQKRYKSSSTSMSMALAEASIQSLLDFLRLNLWIWFDGFYKRGSLDKGKGRGGGGEGWKELRMKERTSVTTWTILYALNAELSSSTVKLGLFLTRKNKQQQQQQQQQKTPRATQKINAIFLCYCFRLFHLHLLVFFFVNLLGERNSFPNGGHKRHINWKGV